MIQSAIYGSWRELRVGEKELEMAEMMNKVKSGEVVLPDAKDEPMKPLKIMHIPVSMSNIENGAGSRHAGCACLCCPWDYCGIWRCRRNGEYE